MISTSKATFAVRRVVLSPLRKETPEQRCKSYAAPLPQKRYRHVIQRHSLQIKCFHFLCSSCECQCKSIANTFISADVPADSARHINRIIARFPYDKSDFHDANIYSRQRRRAGRLHRPLPAKVTRPRLSHRRGLLAEPGAKRLVSAYSR